MSDFTFTVAISFTSESGDRYLSMLQGISEVSEVVETIKEEYGEEFAYLYIDCVVTSDGVHDWVSNSIRSALVDAIWEQQP